jgi:cytochrome c biogenesis protein CcdA
MATFLKVVSGIYLAFVWLVAFGVLSAPPPVTASMGSSHTVVFLIVLFAVGLSIPAVALFAFGQVVGDVRIIRNNARLQNDHLRAMRSYYEPEQRQHVV